MINKNELLEQLQEFDYFVVTKLVDLTTGEKRGIVQSSLYDNVELEWNGSTFKFWNDKDEDVKMFLDSNITEYDFYKKNGATLLNVHIEDCPETIEIRCDKRIH